MVILTGIESLKISPKTLDVGYNDGSATFRAFIVEGYNFKKEQRSPKGITDVVW